MENVFKYSQMAPKRKREGFITETPLNMIQTTKMVMNPTYSNNPLINYKKNIINSQKLSKKFSVTQNHTTETNSFINIDLSELKSEDSENNERFLLKEEKNKKEIRYIKPINFYKTRDYFLKKGQKTERSTESNTNFLLEKRPCTEKSNFRLCQPFSRVLLEPQQISKEITFNKPQENKMFKALTKNLYIKTEESGKSDNLCLEKEKTGDFSSKIKDLEMPQINMFASNTNPEIHNEKIIPRQSMALKSPLSTMTTPEEFRDLGKLELRRKIFRKFSLTKREKKPIVQTISLEEKDTANLKSNEETDLKYFMDKRKEFEGLYEEELYKMGYFNDTHDENNYSFLNRDKKSSNLIQRDMNGKFKNSVLQMKRIFKNEIEAGTTKLYEKYFSENNENFGKSKNDSFLRAQENILTNKELELVKKEYKKSSPDFDLLDHSLKPLKFFTRFDRITRVELLQRASLKEYQPEEIIFNQGDFGNYMYVILKGAINIRKLRVAKEGIEQNTVINTLYDGEMFGELAMMGTTQKKEKNTQDLTNAGKENLEENEKEKQDKLYIERTKRMATAQAAETTYVLEISREYFKKVLLSISQKELDEKLNFLMNIPAFSVFEGHSLIPLANHFKFEYFGTGEIILEEGEKPTSLYIIKQGSCKLIKKIEVQRDLHPSVYTKGLRKALPHFYFGKFKKEEIPEKQKFNEEKNDEITESKKIFCKPKIKDEKLHYIDYIEYGTLNEGDMIGQRAIFDMKKVKENDYTTPRLQNIEESKISVIVDSNMVEVMKLERRSMGFIPEFLKVALSKEIKNTEEFDENIEVYKDVEKSKNWNKYKTSFISKIIKNDALNKNAKNFYKMY